MQGVLGVSQDWVPPICLFHYFKVCAVFLGRGKKKKKKLSSNGDSPLRDVLIHLFQAQPPLSFWRSMEGIGDQSIIYI